MMDHHHHHQMKLIDTSPIWTCPTSPIRQCKPQCVYINIRPRKCSASCFHIHVLIIEALLSGNQDQEKVVSKSKSQPNGRTDLISF